MPRAKAKKSRLRPWSEDEVKLLKKLFPQGQAGEIAERTGRSLEAVKHKAYNMGIKTRECRHWSAHEVQLLKELYRDETAQSIADKLGRSCEAVNSKASSIGLRRREYPLWSKQEITLLRKLYSDNNPRDIANELGRTVSAVTARAHILGLTERLRFWSKRELDLLKKLYPSRTAAQIAEQIGRSERAIEFGIHKLGLEKRLRYEQRHRVVNGTKEKLCGKCRKWKDESQFYKSRSSKDGVQWQCKECACRCDRKRYERIRKDGRNLRYEECHRTVGEVREKFCRKCKRWKNETAFYKNMSAKDGLNAWCKKCSCKAASKSYERKRTDVRRNLRYEECHRVVNGVRQKLCNKCRRWQKESGFYKNRAANDGLMARCMKCSYKATGISRKK